MHAAFKTVSNAIELAMIASSTALMQACKRGAPSVVNKCMRCSQLSSVRSVDHSCWLSRIDTGMRAYRKYKGSRYGDLPFVKRRPRENVTLSIDMSIFYTSYSVAWVLLCATHTQHAHKIACCATRQRCMSQYSCNHRT